MAGASVSFTMSFQGARASFFDRRLVGGKARRGLVRALSRLGAFVWTRSRTSIRYRKGASVPGTPPSAHTTALIRRLKKRGGRMRREGQPQLSSPLREFIFFWSESGPSWEGVVAGPVLLHDRRGGAQALAALEYGGPSVVRTTNRQYRQIQVAARPFMRPALATEIKKLPKLLRKLLG